MSGVNKVILIGNLGKDPEVRPTDSGNKVANFSIACSESYKDKNTGEKIDKTEWVNIVFWGNTVNVIETYIKKGSRIYVEGKLQTRKYNDKEGNTRYVTEVLGSSLTMLGSNDNSSNQQNEPQEEDSSGLPF